MHVVQHRKENELRVMFRAQGAVSPATARSAKDLPAVDAASFDKLLRAGVIREGAPGTYYLYEPTRPVFHLVRRAFFFAVIILLPVGIIQFCGSAP